jgi:hypothetical protein
MKTAGTQLVKFRFQRGDQPLLFGLHERPDRANERDAPARQFASRGRLIHDGKINAQLRGENDDFALAEIELPKQRANLGSIGDNVAIDPTGSGGFGSPHFPAPWMTTSLNTPIGITIYP